MIDLVANFGSVISGLGAADAYLALDTNNPYWNAIIDYAFIRAEEEFNNSAAAYAESGGEIKHMFEWGTLGVNRQATNVRPQPTEERARLWKTFILNRGPRGGVIVDYEFKPSVADVPISTAIPQEIRAMMTKHQFRWKAKVMEEGRPVEISRKDAEFLIIPYRPGAEGFRPHDKLRGYTMTKATIHAVPGRRVQGNFEAFWTRYWTMRGPERMQEILEEEIMTDFLPYFAATGGKAKMSANIIESVKAKSKEVQKEITAKAKARRARYGK